MLRLLRQATLSPSYKRRHPPTAGAVDGCR
nr:MAG TPA: hypothetical protein [Caudoviricetes sp.]